MSKVRKKLTIKRNDYKKSLIKQAMLESFMNQSSPKKKSMFIKMHKPIFATLSVFIVAATVLGYNITRTPLTAQRVIAGALENLENAQSAGRYQFTKTREEITYGEKTIVTYTEAWNDSVTQLQAGTEISEKDYQDMLYASRTVLEDGRVLSEYVSIDGKSYERNVRDITIEILGYDPYAPFDSSMTSSFLPDGFVEAGLPSNAFETMSMKEIDDALISAGQNGFFVGSVYKTGDFPAYAMDPEELNKLSNDMMNSSPEETEAFYLELYGGQDNMITSEDSNSIAVLPDGTNLEGEEAEAYLNTQNEQYSRLDSLRNGSFEDKKKALEELKDKDSVEINLDASWDGKKAIAINISSVEAVAFSGSTNILYLEPKSFRLIGEEYSFEQQELDESMAASLPAGMSFPSRVRVTYLEQWSTDTRPNISIEELTPSEQLYEFMNVGNIESTAAEEAKTE